MNTNDAIAYAKLLESRGLMLSIAKGNLSIMPGSQLTDDDKRIITSHRQTLIDVIGRRCLGCKKLRDEKSRCWKCFTRLCSICGRDTGSCFIELCLRCQADNQRSADDE